MMKTSKLFRLGAAALLISTAGCGTIANFATQPHGPSIYGGIVGDVELMSNSTANGKSFGMVLGVLDFPLSLVLDTATLPFTILSEIFGWRR